MAQIEQLPHQAAKDAGRWRGRWTVCVFLLAALAFHLARSRAAYWNVDDAGIVYAYARALAHGSASAYPEGPRVEGYSSPLHCFIVAGLYALRIFDPITTHLVLEALLFGVAVACLFSLLNRRIGAWGALLGAGTFAALELMTPSTWLWYGSGLENVLLTAGLAALIVRADRILEDRVRPVFDGALAAAVSLIRPEGPLYVAAFFAALILVFLIRTRRSQRVPWAPLAKTMGVTALSAAAFLAWRYTTFGDFFPNTYYAKGHNTGLLAYFNEYVVHMVLPYRYTALFVACTFGLLALARFRALAVVVILLLCASVQMPAYKGNDWMGEHRFATPLFALSHIGFALLVAAAWSASRKIAFRVASAVASAGMLILLSRAGNPIVKGTRLHPITIGLVADIQGARRIDHQRRLGLINPTVILPDAGGSLLMGAMRHLDSGYLTDYQTARLFGKKELFSQYQHQEQGAHLADTNLLPFFAFDASLVDSLFLRQPDLHMFARRDLVDVPKAPPASALVVERPGVRIFTSDRTVPIAGPGGLLRIEVIVERESAAAAAPMAVRAALGSHDEDEISLAPYGQAPGPAIERRAFLIGAPKHPGRYDVSMTFSRGTGTNLAFPLAKVEVISDPAAWAKAAQNLLADPRRDARAKLQALAQLQEQSIERLSHRAWLAELSAFRDAKDRHRREQALHLRRLVWDARLAAFEETPRALDLPLAQAADRVITEARCDDRTPPDQLLCLGQTVQWLRSAGVFGVTDLPKVKRLAEQAVASSEKSSAPVDRYRALVGRTLLRPEDMTLQRALLDVRAGLRPLPKLQPYSVH
jgi:hypothetical protein